ncbi:MAG TPA: BREX-1 system adenine-specific DNA-methyltransferase PglX, partial [Ruminococcaceae bacterium]|nr:BREX-1 system adenine-specific DNA-methyltransferase PglX [Oscillospiraceae bacterium]
KYLVEPESAGSSTIGEAADGAPIISEVAQLKLLDPACGSGHILVEGFDLLYAMYREEGYSAGESVRSIFENNLFGLDIDQRATQLSNFALLLKAAAKDRTILDHDLLPHVYAMPEKEVFTREEVLEFLGSANSAHVDALYNALELMQQSQNLGSIMKFSFSDTARDAIIKQTAAWKSNSELDLVQQDLWKRLTPYMQVLQVLTTKYEAVAANPPYMGGGNMNDELKKYLVTNYPDSKSDLFAVFIEAMINFCTTNGKLGCITMESWMFLSSYEKLRKKIIDNYYIASLAHFGWHIIGIAFGTAAMILNKRKENGLLGQYSFLTIDDVDRELNIPYVFPKKDNGRFSHISQANFEKIPGSPIAYWVSERVVELYSKNEFLYDNMDFKTGITTGDNVKYTRQWFELNKSFEKKWLFMRSGSSFKKWYGSLMDVVLWENDGYEIKKFKGSTIRNPEYQFKEAITWSKICSGDVSVRYSPQKVLFDAVGLCGFGENKDLLTYMSILNSKIGNLFLRITNASMSILVSDIGKIPRVKINQNLNTTISNISISKSDWDSRETSWDFETHPLIKSGQNSLQLAYQAWESKVTQDFYQLHANEVELNRIFIDIYGLQDELTPEVKLKDITILQEELDPKAFGEATEPVGALPIKQDVVMRQLISYLMGCLMGRYRLDKPGLHIAHPNPTSEEIVAYAYNNHTVAIDEDGIVPLMDSSCSFADNALIRLKFLLEVQWGNDKQMVETINFMEAALGKDLETFLVKDFWKDHCSRYQKRPIYWLFASPKGAFQVIAYMHRMNKYTIDKIRSKYLLVHIRNLENQLSALQADNASLNREQSKRMEKVRAD